MDSSSSKGLRLLSLDGGGVRGLASLLILQRIMYNLDSKIGPEVERPLLPCKYFDMIAGTSTGGLIAIMLGVLRMDIDTCISEYLSMAPEIFPEEDFVSKSKLGKLWKGVKGTPRFDVKNFERVVKHMVFAASGSNGDSVLLQSDRLEQDPPQCRTFVCVTNKDVGKPFRLRNYRSAWEPGTGCTIWQAARATSAAPLYFPPIRFGKPPANYVDGGLNYNNPVRSVYDEAKSVWGKSHREIKCIISIGTGVPPLKATGDTGKQILESVVAIATDTQKTADEFIEEMAHLPENAKIDYFRLNVDRGLENMKLEEWKDFDMLTGATSYYLNNHKAELDRCAKSLLDSDASEERQSSCSVILSDLPVTSHPFFGRASELSQLHTMLSLQHDETGCKAVVLWGLGGFGKTRIALEYLKTYQRNYSAILWINTATFESAEDSFAQVASVLRSRQVLQPNTPLAGNRGNLGLVQQWLTSSKNTGWLVVFDSLDDLESSDCRDLIPHCSHGNIIVTSTLSNTMDVLGFQGLEVSGLNLVHGCEMLLFGGGIEPGSGKEIPTQIIRAMHGVPLAIEQARAMIKQGMPMQDFLGHYETQYQRVMEHKPPKSAWDYEKNLSLVSIFNMLLTKVDKDSDAKNILAFASCFGPRQVAVNLLVRARQPSGSTESSRPSQSDLEDSPLTWLDYIGHNPLALHFATSHLESLCLLKIKRDRNGAPVSIALHDSISRWRFASLNSDERERWIIAAACALGNHLPKESPGQSAQLQLLPLVRHFHNTIQRYIESRKLEAPDGEHCHQYGRLMARFAPLYLYSGYPLEGEYIFSQAIDYQRIMEEALWPKDRRSLLLLKGLAMMLSKIGRMEDAAETTEALHHASANLLGPRDEITSWAAARLPAVRDRKIGYAENEHRAIVASRGDKLSLATPGHTSRPTSELPAYTAEHPFEPEVHALILAASKGDIRVIRRILKRGTDFIDVPGADTRNALHWASKRGHGAAVQMLLGHGADVNFKNEYGTALHAACREGHTEIIEILLMNGADVNSECGSFGTPLWIASIFCPDSVVESLLSHGADVDATCRGRTALWMAAYNGQYSMTQLLLRNGADANTECNNTGTASQAAKHLGYNAIADLLKAAGARDDDLLFEKD